MTLHSLRDTNLRLLLCASALAVSACAGRPVDRPEPVIQIQRVEVPVPIPCNALSTVGHPPVTPDTNEALRSAPNIAERAKLLMAGRALRIGWTVAADAAISVCSRP